MRAARVFMHGRPAGVLQELANGGYRFDYDVAYLGPPVSLAMPMAAGPHAYAGFPPFFDGLLPEGPQLEALLRHWKLDRSDLLGQLLAVGGDLVGAVTVAAMDAPA